ncbi:hypothetical protein [uncultured Corynebacterium sp.]|uniref:hypothetical protein n=1 Tax=uncultured Corynebacterium sp. TaxID=159447 RepID=UPI00260AC7C1|nr:hypothetical protein [uncultured Corynebacterium sp.]
MTNTTTFDTNMADEDIKQALINEAKKDFKVTYNSRQYLVDLVTEAEDGYGPDGIYAKAQEALARAIHIAEYGSIDEDANLFIDDIEYLVSRLDEALETKTPEQQQNIITQALNNPEKLGYHWDSVDDLLQDVEAEVLDYIADIFLAGAEFTEFKGEKYLVRGENDYFSGLDETSGNAIESLLNGITALTYPEGLDPDNGEYYSDYTWEEIQVIVDHLSELIEKATDKDYDEAREVLDTLGLNSFGYYDHNIDPLFGKRPALTEDDIEDVLDALQENIVTAIRDYA